MRVAPRFHASLNVPQGIVLVGNKQFLKMLIDLIESADKCDSVGSVEHALLLELKRLNSLPTVPEVAIPGKTDKPSKNGGK